MEKINWEKLKKITKKRNQQIFREYQRGKISMSKLGEKHGLTRARVSYIIKAEREKASIVNTIDKS